MGDEYNFDPQAFDDNAQAIFNGTPELDTGLIAGGIVQDNAADLAGGGINYDITQQEASTFWDSMTSQFGGEAGFFDSLSSTLGADFGSPATESAGFIGVSPAQREVLARGDDSMAKNAKEESGVFGKLLNTLTTGYTGAGAETQKGIWGLVMGAAKAYGSKGVNKAQQNYYNSQVALNNNKIAQQGSAGAAWDKIPKMRSQFTQVPVTPMQNRGLISGG